MSHVKIVFKQRMQELCIAPRKVSKDGHLVFESVADLFSVSYKFYLRNSVGE